MPTAEHLPTADEMGMKGRRACEIVGSKSCALRCAGAEAACESGLVSVRRFPLRFNTVRKESIIRIYRQDWNRHYIENIYHDPYLRVYAIAMYRDNLTRIFQHNPAFCTCRSGRPTALLGDGDPIGA